MTVESPLAKEYNRNEDTILSTKKTPEDIQRIIESHWIDVKDLIEFKAMRDKMKEELKAEIRSERQQIIAELQNRETPEGPGTPDTPTTTPEGPGQPIDTWIWSTPDSTNGIVPQGPPQNVIPPGWEGGSVGWFTPSPDAPPASPWAVWVWDPKPIPTNVPYNPFE